MKKIYSVCIFMVLPFLIACNENHSFSLDESRQLLIVHNFLHMEIESDCLDPSESHLFFITKKNEFDTRSCDTINFRNVSSALSVEEMNSYGITKNLRRIKYKICCNPFRNGSSGVYQGIFLGRFKGKIKKNSKSKVVICTKR